MTTSSSTLPAPAGDAIRDVTIIGGGPTGLAAAYYAGHRDASVRIIDSLPELGGQVQAVYPEKHIYDIAGHPKVQAAEFCRLLTEQASQFDPQVLLETTCEGLDMWTAEDGGDLRRVTVEEARELPSEELLLRLTSGSGQELWTRTLIIAGGHGAFEPRKLPIDDIDAWAGHGLHYHVRRVDDFAGRQVVIVGGGDSALDWTLGLSDRVAGPLRLVHRRDRFRAVESSVTQMRELAAAGTVDLRVPAEVTAIHGNGHVEAVTITDRDSGAEEQVECDALVTLLGFKSALGPIAGWGLEMAGRRAVAVNPAMETNLPNVFAAGDIAGYEGKITLITIDMGEAAIAANQAITRFRPEARLQPTYSTD